MMFAGIYFSKKFLFLDYLLTIYSYLCTTERSYGKKTDKKRQYE